MRIEVLERLCHCKAAAQQAHAASLDLMRRFDLRYNLDRWAEPAVVAYQSRRVVGFIQFKLDAETKDLTIPLAWCDPDFPQVLARMLLKARPLIKEKGARTISFGHHIGNNQMERLAQLLKAKPTMASYEMEIVK